MYMSSRSACNSNGHVLKFQVDISCSSTCGMSGHVLLKFYCKTCLAGSQVLLKSMYYRRTYFTVGDVILGYMFYRRVYLTG